MNVLGHGDGLALGARHRLDRQRLAGHLLDVQRRNVAETLRQMRLHKHTTAGHHTKASVVVKTVIRTHTRCATYQTLSWRMINFWHLNEICSSSIHNYETTCTRDLMIFSA